MAKTTKKRKKKASSSPEDLSAHEKLIDEARIEAEGYLELIKASRQQSLKEMQEDAEGRVHIDKALLSTFNSLTKSIAALSQEQRQLDKHTGILLDRLTADDEDAIVREHLLELPRPRRRAFLEMLQGLEDDKDLLAL